MKNEEVKEGQLVVFIEDKEMYEIIHIHPEYFWIEAEQVSVDGKIIYNKKPSDFEFTELDKWAEIATDFREICDSISQLEELDLYVCRYKDDELSDRYASMSINDIEIKFMDYQGVDMKLLEKQRSDLLGREQRRANRKT